MTTLERTTDPQRGSLHSSNPDSTAPRWTGPLFLIGMPRSGTKLVRALLVQHPRILIPTIETNFFPFLARWVEERGQPHTDAEFRELHNALRHSPYFQLRQSPARFQPEAWRACCAGQHDARGLFEGFMRYELALPPGSDKIWGDKSPSYTRHIGALLEHFPEGKIIHIVRDVRDYCASVRKAWNKDVRRAAYQWAIDVAYAHGICMANTARCIEVKYEDVLADPGREVQRLAEFAGVEFFDGMTRLSRPEEHVGDAAGRTEIVRENARKFAQRMAPREVRIIEELSFDTMQALGYRPVHAQRQTHLSSFDQWRLRMKDGVSLVKGRARRSGLLRAIQLHLTHARMSSGPSLNRHP